MKKIAITTGDPAGIGPEITTKALRFIPLTNSRIFIVYGKIEKYNSGNEICKIKSPEEATDPKCLYWIEIDEKVELGKSSEVSGLTTYKILEKCADHLVKGEIQGVVTCPICKESIQKTYPDFIGHTEFFARAAKVKKPIMSFWGPHFNLALLTTHLALCDVSAQLTKKFLRETLESIYTEVTRILTTPRIAMLAVNPHAGENGAFGDDDNRIKSVLELLRSEGMNIDGPFPADTFFSTKVQEYDLIISAYHDQGLIPFKMLSSEEGVNVTLGLPFVRTSVDHGTAFDIAGKGIASEKSLIAAIDFAEEMLKTSRQNKYLQYSVFAEYYDSYMEHVPYNNWLKFILEQFHRYHKRNPRNCLELACGTGNLANKLVKLEIEVDAADISASMLNIAARKSFAPNLINRDITEPFAENHYELVILIFDSFNYLTTKHQIREMLKNVYSSLRNKGLFIFDIVTKKKCETYLDGYVNLVDSEDDYMIHQSSYLSHKKLHRTQLTFFKRKAYLFERFDEIHQQRVYLVDEITEQIVQTEFELRTIHSMDKKKNLISVPSNILDNNFSRLFFVLQK